MSALYPFANRKFHSLFAGALNLDTWFEKGPTQAIGEADIYSLTQGTRLYNARLQNLNRTDIYAAGRGEGLNAERRGLTDVDHEEFYGAARGPASFNEPSSFEQL